MFFDKLQLNKLIKLWATFDSQKSLIETFTTKIITTYKTKRNKNKQRIAQKSMKKYP